VISILEDCNIAILKVLE
jgi:hypothetical protein